MSASEKRRRTAWLPAIRCHDEEATAVREKAASCGLSVGSFVLKAALGHEIKSKVDAQIVNELRRLGGLQKHLFTEGGKQHSKEYSDVLVAITTAIARIAV